jgi:hypothetical protein
MELHRLPGLSSALDGAAQTNRFTHGETDRVTHSVGGCVSPREGLDTVAKKYFRPLYATNLESLVVQPAAFFAVSWYELFEI